MKPLYIPQIRQAPNATVELDVNDAIADLDTLTPVRGSLTITHQLNYLEVSAIVETITTLVCHRCLSHYNHRLQVNNQELIWLDDVDGEQGDPTDLNTGDFSETLSPQGYFDPQNWLYEQLNLAMPLQQVCGESCPGIDPDSAQTSPPVDQRWSGLAALKQQLDDTPEESSTR